MIGRTTARIAALGAMADFAKLEERILAHQKKQQVLMLIPSRDITDQQLQMLLGMMDVYGKVETRTYEELKPQGRRGQADLWIDDIGVLDMKMVGLTATGRIPRDPEIQDLRRIHLETGLPSYSLKAMAEALLGSKKLDYIEPKVAHEEHTYPTHNRNRQSKGDKHRNKRYRWS